MIILLTSGRMDITAKDNKLLTTIVKVVDNLPLRRHAISDIRISVEGSNEILYELLMELTVVYPGRVEII